MPPVLQGLLANHVRRLRWASGVRPPRRISVSRPRLLHRLRRRLPRVCWAAQSRVLAVPCSRHCRSVVCDACDCCQCLRDTACTAYFHACGAYICIQKHARTHTHTLSVSLSLCLSLSLSLSLPSSTACLCVCLCVLALSLSFACDGFWLTKTYLW